MNPVAWHRSLASSRRSRSTHLTSPAADLGKTRNEIEIKYTYYFCVLILGPKKITQPEFGLRAQKKFRFHVSLLGGGISPARAGPVVLGDVEVGQSRGQLPLSYGIVSIVGSSVGKFSRRASSKGVEFATFAVVLVPVVESRIRL